MPVFFMASNTHFILIFFISLLNLLHVYSLSYDIESDYNKWLSWNVENHNRKRSSFKPKSTILRTSSGTHGIGNVTDYILQRAEMNKTTIIVSQEGTGNFTTIGEAIYSIPRYNTRRTIIAIKPGLYREKVNVPYTKPYVTFLGDPSDPPIISGNDTASVTGKDGRPLKTFLSYTVGVDSNYFVAINIKFENTAPHEDGSGGGQAVALRISGNKAAFYNCSFYGSQDTLYDHKGLHYFNNCFIQGSVDFIFGYGRSLYENCHLNSIAKKVASLTAQKRSSSSMESGFSFKNCVVTGSGMVYLGRSWGDYSRVVFAFTFMDSLVLPQGWNDWGVRKRDSRVYYAEYACIGPGANYTGRVPWARILTDEEAQPFIGTYYINGDSWLLSQ